MQHVFLPTIEVIEDSLFRQDYEPVSGGGGGTVRSFMDLMVEEPELGRTPGLENTVESTLPPGGEAMPAALRQAIAQRLSARQAYQVVDKLEPGMIVLVTPPGSRRDPLAMDLPVLLDHLMPGNDLWRGWLVAPQTHMPYVAYWDLLLEEELDGPFDPVAAIVQIWNPVYVKVAEPAMVMGHLDRERIAAARAVDEEFRRGFVKEFCEPEPGRFGVREAAGRSVVTGTPLGDVHDERRDYQRLYSRAAAALSDASSETVSDALAADWLSRIARGLEQWAATLGIIFAPRPAIPEPMGAGRLASIYLLDRYAQLSLHPYPNEQVLHVQISAIDDTVIEAVLKAGDEELQTAHIGKTYRIADFFMDLRQGHVLKIRIPGKGTELEIPVT